MNFVFYGSDFEHKQGEFCPRKSLNYHFISFFRTDYLYEADGAMHYGKSGDILIIPRGGIVYHGPTPEMTEGFRNDWLYIDGDDFLEIIEKYPVPIGKPFSIGGRRTLAVCVERIHKELSFAAKGYSEMCDLYMRETVIEIHRAYIKENNATAADKLEKLRGEMARDPRKNWTLSSMAKFCGYSESRFSALYRDAYSISPIADLINIRLESAKLLLSFSSMTVSEIAETTGFSSVYYFSKYFKRNSGFSPSEYRKIPR